MDVLILQKIFHGAARPLRSGREGYKSGTPGRRDPEEKQDTWVRVRERKKTPGRRDYPRRPKDNVSWREEAVHKEPEQIRTTRVTDITSRAGQ